MFSGRKDFLTLADANGISFRDQQSSHEIKIVEKLWETKVPWSF